MALAMRGCVRQIGRLRDGELECRRCGKILTCETGKGEVGEWVVVVGCDVKEIESGVVGEVGAGEGGRVAGGAGVLDGVDRILCGGCVEGIEDAVLWWKGQSGGEEMHGVGGRRRRAGVAECAVF